jgi:hypothetical protein
MTSVDARDAKRSAFADAPRDRDACERLRG